MGFNGGARVIYILVHFFAFSAKQQRETDDHIQGFMEKVPWTFLSWAELQRRPSKYPDSSARYKLN